MNIFIGCMSLFILAASWLAIRWSEESRKFDQILKDEK